LFSKPLLHTISQWHWKQVFAENILSTSRKTILNGRCQTRSIFGCENVLFPSFEKRGGYGRQRHIVDDLLALHCKSNSHVLGSTNEASSSSTHTSHSSSLYACKRKEVFVEPLKYEIRER